MCVGHPAEKLDQIDVMKGLRRPADGIDRAACVGSQNGLMRAMVEAYRFAMPLHVHTALKACFYRKRPAVRPACDGDSRHETKTYWPSANSA